MRPVKVLYIVGSSGFGGVESFLLSLSSAHNPSNVIPYFYFLNNGPLVDEIKKKSNNIFLSKANYRIRNPASYLRALRELREIIKNQNIDVLHSCMAYPALLGSVAAFISSKIHVWFQHGPVSGWMDWLAGILFSHGILFNSEHAKKSQLKLHFFLKFRIEKKSKVLYLGTNIPTLKSASTNSDLLRIVMLARSQPSKGVDVLLDALKLVIEANSSIRADIFLAGEQDEYRASLEKKRKEIGDHVFFHPPTKNITEVYLNADCLVNSSRVAEGFGLTIIEAMAYGVAPIAPKLGGPVEIIEENRTGLFFEAGNAGDLASKIRYFQSNPNQLNRMRIEAAKVASERFSIQKMVVELEKYYLEIISTKRSDSTGQ